MTNRPSLWRLTLAVAIPLIAVGLVFALLAAVRTGADPPATAAAGPTSAVATAPTAPTAAETSISANTGLSTAPDLLPSAQPSPKITTSQTEETKAEASAVDVVAMVNGAPITRALLAEALAVDQIMSGLANQPATAPRTVLEQVVNGELVWQTLLASGGPAPGDTGPRALQAFLQANQRSEQDLAGALDAAGLARDRFDAYFGRLVAVDQFVRGQGTNAGAYLRQLQQAARISFGPAADAALVAAPPSSEPVVAAAGAITDALAAAPPVEESTLAQPTPTLAAEPRGVEPGQLAPDFTLFEPTERGKSTSSNDILGRPVVLSFWTTWCPYCLRQTPCLSMAITVTQIRKSNS